MEKELLWNSFSESVYRFYGEGSTRSKKGGENLVKVSPYDVMECVGNVDVVVNAVNTKGYMGKGLALEFKLRFPKLEEDYKKACESGELSKGGDVWIWKGNDIFGRNAVVANIATKEDYKAPSKIEWIERGVKSLREILSSNGYKSVALPKLGAGLGKLNWDVVEDVIVNAFHGEDFEVIICKDISAGEFERSLISSLVRANLPPRMKSLLTSALRSGRVRRLRDIMKIKGISEKSYREILEKAWAARALL